MSLPDQLTVARIAAVPIVVLLFAWDFPNHAYWATAVFVVAMATDQIDGWLARRRGISSALGKLLDPVADKVLVLAALVMLVGEGVAPAWMIALIVVREILVSGLRLAAVERGVVLGARDLGRAKTWAQALAREVEVGEVPERPQPVVHGEPSLCRHDAGARLAQVEIVVIPRVAAAQSRVLVALLEEAGIRPRHGHGYESAWRRSALNEAVERCEREEERPPGDVVAPRSGGCEPGDGCRERLRPRLRPAQVPGSQHDATLDGRQS